MKLFAATCFASLLAACAPSLGDDLLGEDDRRDGEIGRDAVLSAIADHADPMAEYLRAAISQRGTIAGDFQNVVSGVGDLLGCDEQSESRFVVLSNEGFAPKTVVTRCSQSNRDASRFFLALPAYRPDGDVDPQFAHVSAWDDAAKRYRVYSMYADESGEMAINVEPRFCLGCHGGPEKLDYWTPIMNELSNPWSQWQATPDFPSQLFEENLDTNLASAAGFSGILDSASSASALEPVVRSGIDRVTEARVLGRSADRDIEAALDMVRPLFCDESVNFVSERHGTGRFASAAAVDTTIGDLAAAAGQPIDASWFRDLQMELLPAAPGDSPLVLMPTRGEATRQLELALVSRQVISPMLALRVRAVDWSRPLGSEYRCQLFHSGAERVRDLGDDFAPSAATIAEMLPDLIEELLPQAPTPGSDVVALFDATTVDWQSLTIGEFADQISQYVSSLDRATMDAIRKRRACDTAALYPLTPLVPELVCD